VPARRRPPASLFVHVIRRGRRQAQCNGRYMAAVVGFNLHFNALAKAQIMGLFKR
jgi:hypothetical protein